VANNHTQEAHEGPVSQRAFRRNGLLEFSYFPRPQGTPSPWRLKGSGVRASEWELNQRQIQHTLTRGKSLNFGVQSVPL
jgi:hypothetical protein